MFFFWVNFKKGSEKNGQTIFFFWIVSFSSNNNLLKHLVETLIFWVFCSDYKYKQMSISINSLEPLFLFLCSVFPLLRYWFDFHWFSLSCFLPQLMQWKHFYINQSTKTNIHFLFDWREMPSFFQIP